MVSPQPGNRLLVITNLFVTLFYIESAYSTVKPKMYTWLEQKSLEFVTLFVS